MIDSQQCGAHPSQKPVVVEFQPRGLSRIAAANYIGISPSKFDELVAVGTMPPPKAIGRRRLWCRRELDAFFDELPSADQAAARNPWTTQEV